MAVPRASAPSDAAPARYARRQERLAVGGWRFVEATDTVLGRDILLGIVEGRGTAAERLVHAVAGLQHACLAKVFDADPSGGEACLVFEDVAATDLEPWIAANATLSGALSLTLARELADMLRLAADRGLALPAGGSVRIHIRAGRLVLSEVPWVTRAEAPTDVIATQLVGRTLLTLVGEAPAVGVPVAIRHVAHEAAAGAFPTLEDLERALVRAERAASLEVTQAVPVVPAARQRVIAFPSRLREYLPTDLRRARDWRLLLPLVLLVGLAGVLIAQRAGTATPACDSARPTFVGALATLQGRLGRTMGEPRECARRNPENGDLVQQTSTGLAYIRSSTGLAAFTDGNEHWALSDRGVLRWTGEAVDPPRSAELLPAR